MKPTIKNYVFLHVAFDIFYHYGLHEMGLNSPLLPSHFLLLISD